MYPIAKGQRTGVRCYQSEIHNAVTERRSMMKVIRRNYPLALVMAAAVLAFGTVLVFTSQPVRASETDNRIESAFKKTYVYKTYLKDEHIKISS